MNFPVQNGSMTMPEIWIVILIAMLIVEISTVALTSIWFAAGAAAALIAALCGTSLWIQIAVFAVVSVILLFTIRPLSVRFFLKKPEKTNVEGFSGKDAVVTEDIDNIERRGAATVAGIVWTARMATKDGKCPKGAICTVDHVEGVKLILRDKEREDE